MDANERSMHSIWQLAYIACVRASLNVAHIYIYIGYIYVCYAQTKAIYIYIGHIYILAGHVCVVNERHI